VIYFTARRCRSSRARAPGTKSSGPPSSAYFSDLPLLDTPWPEFDKLVYTKWLAEMGEPGSDTERGRRFDSVVKYLAGGDMPLRCILARRQDPAQKPAQGAELA